MFSRSWKKARLLFFAVILFSPAVHAREEGQGFSLFFQTAAINKKLGAYIAVDAGTYDDVDALPDVLDSIRAPSGEVLAPLDEELKVVIVLPKGARQEYVDSYSAQVREGLAKKLGARAQYEIAYSYVDTEKELTELDHDAKATDQPEVQTALALESENVREWRDAWWGRFAPIDAVCKGVNCLRHPVATIGEGIGWLNKRNPLHRTIAARTVAMGKGVIALTVTLHKYGVNWSSGFISVFNSVVTAAFGYYATEYSNWCTKHNFFLSRRFPQIEKGPIRFYNEHPEFKSISINVIRSFGLSYISRLLAYLSHQVDITKSPAVPVESPNSLAFFWDAARLTGVEIVADSALDVGLRALAQNKHITYMGRSYMIWSVGVLDTAMHAFFRTGDLRMTTILLGVGSTIKVAAYVIGKAMPFPKKHLYVISDAIPRTIDGKPNLDFTLVVKTHGLDEAWKITSTPEELAELQKQRPDQIAKNLNLGDISARNLEQLVASIQDYGSTVRDTCAATLLHYNSTGPVFLELDAP